MIPRDNENFSWWRRHLDWMMSDEMPQMGRNEWKGKLNRMCTVRQSQNNQVTLTLILYGRD